MAPLPPDERPAGRVADALGAIDARRAGRRRFLTLAGSAVAATGGLSLLGACGNDGTSNATPTPTPTATATATSGYADTDIINFALNLEYLEANFFYYAAFGSAPSIVTSGYGTAGTVTGGAQVTFTDPLVASYAREIAADEVAHIGYLQTLLTGYGTGVAAYIAQPAINIDGTSATGAFALAAQAAGIAASDGTFNPYASDENFLLGALLLEDVMVTAYKGMIPLFTNNNTSGTVTVTTYTDSFAGLLAAESYHAGLIRSVLYRKGVEATATLLTRAQSLSDARDALDGSSDDDQGVGTATVANITPADSNAIAYSRTPGQVLNIAYLTKTAVSKGGFFPSGVNGSIFASAASG